MFDATISFTGKADFLKERQAQAQDSPKRNKYDTKDLK